MANAKEIRSKIGRVKQSKKITGAMQMVAASKMRKTQQNLERTKPYAESIRQVVGHLANGNPEYRHPFLEERPVKRHGLIVVSSDRGLCGGLNTNTFKKAVLHLKSLSQDHGVENRLCIIGTKAENYFKRLGSHIVAQKTHLGDTPKVADVIGVVKVMLEAYMQGELDSISICSNEFVNTMRQVPVVQQLLPLVPVADEALPKQWDYIYEPDAKTLLDVLLTRYIESQVYSRVVENIACEQAARMVAMKNATENAGDIIEGLELVYHKARQASITQEINEIVSGAAAV